MTPPPRELVALLNACRAAPAADLPRLVLADWLDENGDPDRAAFVRAQVELSHPTADAQRTTELEAIAKGLLAANAEEWTGGFAPGVQEQIRRPATDFRGQPGFTPDSRWAFRRGLFHLTLHSVDWLTSAVLLDWLRGSAGHWVEGVDVWFDSAEYFVRYPLPREYFGRLVVGWNDQNAGGNVGDWKRIATCDNFAAVRALRLNIGEPVERLTAIRELAAADPSRLIELVLPFAEEESFAACSALGSAPFTSLSTLNLGHVSTAGIQALARSPHLTSLVKLNLVGSPIGDRGLRALCDSPLMATLCDVSLPNTGIGDEGIVALVRSPLFARMSGPSLNLMMNRIGDAGARELAGSPELLRFRELVLRENRVGDAGAAALADSPHVANFTYLDFWRNRLTDGGAAALADSRHLANVVDLCVKENAIGELGRQALEEKYGVRAKV